MVKNNSKAKNSDIYKVYSLLNKSDKKFLFISIAFQVLLTFLDLLAIMLIAFSVSFVTGVNTNLLNYLTQVQILDISQRSPKFIIIFLLFIVVILFITKTILSAYITLRVIQHFARKSANLMEEIVSLTLDGNLHDLKKVNFQNYIFSTSRGLEAICLQIFAPLTIFVADVITLITMLLVLFYVSVNASIVLVLSFGISALILHKFQATRSQQASNRAANLDMDLNNKVSEILHAFREIYVRDSKKFYKNEIFNLKLSWATAISKVYFFPSITKFTYEGIVIFSALLVGVLETMSTADRSSLSVASIFLAVGFRLAPIALRMQQNVFQIKSNLGTANTTLHLIRDLRNSGEKMNLMKSEHILQTDSSLRVVAQDLTVLNSSSIVALDKIDLEIKAGEKIVIVGPTGSGKTTLVECILGLIPPSQGRILISGLPPSVYIQRNPGLVGYIPQSIFLKSGTVRDNLALGFDSNYFSDSDYWQSLQLAKIDILVDSLPLKLDTNLGEFGGNLSGGERQRLAIARALMTKPKLLIIDEGTSSLDLVTEHEISQEILDFGSDITVIMVAHRTRAMQGFNKIIFLKNGRISDTGSFSDLFARNREFAEMIANNP